MKVFYLFFFLLPVSVVSQGKMQLELQTYEKGVSPGFRFDLEIADNSYLTSKFGFYLTPQKKYNDTYSQQEKGFIYSLGYARTNFVVQNLTAHVRANLWQLSHEQEYNGIICGILPPCPPAETHIKFERKIILQPTLGLEYGILIGKSYFVKPHLSIGYSYESVFSKNGDGLRDFYGNYNEKPRQRGSFIGQGLIIIGGVNLGYNF